LQIWDAPPIKDEPFGSEMIGSHGITLIGLVIQAVNRILRISNLGMDCTFKTVVIGKKLTASARDLMHLLGFANAVSRRCPEAPNHQEHHCPSTKKAQGH